ncbi:hypothetical protein D3C85_774800 [compost metagenome]
MTAGVKDLRKLRESDFVQQRNSSERSLAGARSTRKYDPYKQSKSQKRILSRVVVVAPAKLSFFHDDYAEFWRFISEIKASAKNNILLLDLKPIVTVKVSAMLVLYAVIEQLQKEHSNPKIIKSTACSKADISGKFQSLGFWSLIREGRERTRKFMDDGIPVCTASYANKLSGDEQSQLRMALEYVQSVLCEDGEDEQSQFAFAAITESISNVWQHAYAQAFFSTETPAELKNWWITVEKISDQLFIGVYDMGVGIPTTLGAKPNFVDMMLDAGKGLASLASKMMGREETFSRGERDAASIKAAVDYGKSRFNVSGRGKGLSEAKDFVNNNPRGELFIYSGLGSYSYYAKGSKEVAEALPFEFTGTLIQWNIQLNVPEAKK